jgi:hypothetical protein
MVMGGCNKPPQEAAAPTTATPPVAVPMASAAPANVSDVEIIEHMKSRPVSEQIAQGVRHYGGDDQG